MINLDDLVMWSAVCCKQAKLFKRAMLEAFENLAIAQYRDILRYATIQEGGYLTSIHRFYVDNYVYFQ